MSDSAPRPPKSRPPKSPLRSPPRSIVVTWQCWTGFAGFLAALVLQRYLRWAPPDALIFVLLFTAAPVLCFEGRRAFAVKRLHNPFDRAHLERVAFKASALLQTWAVIALIYWLVPFYANGPGIQFLHLLANPAISIGLVVIVPLYLSLEDRTSPAPEDVLYRIGRKVAGSDVQVARREWTEYAMGWAIKGFFLPIMVSGCTDNIRWWTQIAFLKDDYFSLYDFSYTMAYFADVIFAAVGYLCTLKLFETQIRSSQPLLFGWVVALICYPPFWGGVSDSVFAYNPDGHEWGYYFLRQMPVFAHVWAFVLLMLVIVYVMATIQFGVRFSNLTNRGIITNGPYRWLKHPAYLSKNLSWWMLAVPFLPHTDYLHSVRNCVLLLALNGIYYLRAKTEEWHLSEEPAYREYLAFMAQHGLGAVVRRRFAWLIGAR